ncbi:RHS repeat-associated core domain-containing protein [Agarilytica rhodophyticola]|uniref:RHS repeat-associated core domain-containing protein n=1 Tax=Agarilytica rhodophyticola TaxID=1737490 RepID=UPI000B345649|nr:RHS repeat-associated core domain-containing protein [Agarilytica rhodophyticola]
MGIVTGEESFEQVDAVLPGPMPFKWTRIYRSSSKNDDGLGVAWFHSCSEILEVDVAQVIYKDNRGRVIPFELPSVGERSTNLSEGLTIDRLSKNSFLLKQDGQWDKVFTRSTDIAHYCPLIQLRHSAYTPESAIKDGSGERGFCISVHYNEQQKISRIQGNWGKSLRFKHNAQGRVQTVLLHNEALNQEKIVAEYDYNNKGDLIAHRNAKSIGEKYAYSNHLLVQRTLKTGFNLYFDWDGEDHTATCTHSWGERGIYEHYFDWDKTKKCGKTTDSRGFQCEYYYNGEGQIVEKIDNEGNIHKFHYQDGRKSSDEDPEGNVTQYFYDQHHYAGSRDALGNRFTIDYFKDKPTAIIDKDKTVQRFEYNTHGQLVALIDPYQQRIMYGHNKHGLITSITDPMKRVSRFRWNAQGELVQHVDTLGHIKQFSYDAWGQVVNVSYMDKEKTPINTVEYRYGVTGLVEKIIADKGDTTHYSYDDKDQLIRYSDPQGRTTEYYYDDLGQVIERIDAEGYKLKYEYDTECNLIALINQNEERYQFFYDGNQRLIKEIGFDGRIQHYKYNKAGHLIKHMDAGEVMTEYKRDALGQVLSKTYKSIKHPDQQEEFIRYQYDPKGRLRETYNANQYLAFEYTLYGQLKKEHHSDLDSSGKNRLKNTMVDIGFSHIWPGICSGIQLPDGKNIQYQFDDNNQLSDVIFNSNTITQILRDDFGRETHRHQGVLEVQSSYDDLGRLLKQSSINHRNKAPGVVQREYSYDKFGNISSINDAGNETRFSYDLLNRIEKVEGSHAENFSFDPASNITSVNGYAINYSEGSRIITYGSTTFTYDERGNLVKEKRGKGSQSETEFVYNLQNQLVCTKKDGEATYYKYDPLGRRIRKQSSSINIKYLWLGDQLVQEKGGQVNKTYIYEPESFRPIAMIEDNTIYHFYLDHLGTPKEISDQGGNLVWQAYYKNYGNVALKEINKVENNLRFQGQYFDEESGLLYNRIRYFNPSIGQFTQPNTIGLLGGVNQYQYATNSVNAFNLMGVYEIGNSLDERNPIDTDPLTEIDFIVPCMFHENINYLEQINNRSQRLFSMEFSSNDVLFPLAKAYEIKWSYVDMTYFYQRNTISIDRYVRKNLNLSGLSNFS